ncbi:asialoglycoprotein receptor 1-like [Xenopus laevis]|uniref:C-type lectin domain-containing protein n=2 Tax=Xenopus laevis TaxID=8355 RepID=A0A974HUN8_XENLA|nr:asialoglycoprotein receptor 1-like [Xenopus laevis]OCT90934.1 hypothetical protein XELAEV_18019551mg [Xenopus laevis]
MSKEYQDLQCLQEEETSSTVSKTTGSAMKAYKMQSWATSHSSRLLYGFCCFCAVLLIVIITLIVHLQKPEVKDRSFEYQLGNFSVSVKTQVSQITQEGTRLMEKITDLETSVKKIQNDLSIGSLQSDMQKVLGTLGRLIDRVHKLQLNGSQDPVCPVDWHRFTLSCYYVSKSGYPWEEAKTRCEGFNSHMVVINNEDEQNYVFGIAKTQFTWIGLTDSDGEWKWSDGTPYNTSPKFWIPDQPDNHFGHGLGGGEDCAHLHYNGRWNDDHCSRRYRFICEKAI